MSPIKKHRKVKNRFYFTDLIVIILLFSIRFTFSQQQEVNIFYPEKTAIDTVQITLQNAIFEGLENNHTVSIERLTPKIVKTTADESRAQFDPVLSLTGQRSEVKSLRRLGAQRTPFDMQDNRFDYSMQLAENLPFGTTLAADVGITGSVSNLYTDQFTGSFNLTVTQSLLKGFGTAATLANLRKARLDVEISNFELKGLAQSIAADIEKGYWDLYLSGAEMSIQKQSLELAKQQLDESLERVAVGKLPNIELAAVDAEVAARKVALIDAQSQHEQARLRLLFLLNPKYDSLWDTFILPIDKPFLPQDTLDALQIHEQVGKKYRPDLQQSHLALEKGELDIAQTKNGLLPKLDIFLTLGRTSYSETFGAASYPNVHSPFYQANLGVSFDFPIPNRQASAQARRAHYSQEQKILALENLEKLVEWDIRSTFAEVLRSRQQIEATRVTREMQGKKLDAELEKFRVGKSTNLLVLQVQRDFTASQLDEARAMVSYLYALIDLYCAEGTLLERRHVETFAN